MKNFGIRPYYLILLLLVGLKPVAFAQPCETETLITRSIKAFNTSPEIDWELQNHLVYSNPECTPNNLLLIHLVGTFDNPTSTTFFPIHAANNGFKSIVLKYPNGVSGTTACRTSDDIDCHLKYRTEIAFGIDESDDVEVDEHNCIVNRISKLLHYLNENFPEENWDEFLIEGEINWSSIILTGHSQGGGHAAFIGKYFELNRIGVFASPNEYSSYYDAPASWITLPSSTSNEQIYGFGNRYDDIVDFEEQYLIWLAMDLYDYGDTTNVDLNFCPYENSRMLYTKDTSGTGLAAHHNNMLIDDFTPVVDEIPVYLNVWEYILGICEPTSGIYEPDEKGLLLYPNPTRTSLNIRCEELIKYVEITNIFGQSIQTLNPNGFQLIFNTQGLIGVYWIRIETISGKRYHQKFIVN